MCGWINPLETDIGLHYIQKLNSCFAENTVFVHYKDYSLMLSGEIITVYCDSHTKHINTLSEQGAVSQCSGIWYMLLPLDFK